MFGVIRQRGGYNSNPTASQFRRNLQHAISMRLMTPPDSSNCEPDDDVTLDFPQELFDYNSDNKPHRQDDTLHATADYSDDILHTLPYNANVSILTMPPDNSYENLHPTPLKSVVCHQNNDAPVNLEDTVINYISGWLAKKCIEKFSCVNCTATLAKVREELIVPEECLINFKQFISSNEVNFTGLKRPTSLLYNIMTATTSSFTLHFNTLKTEKNLKKQIVFAMRKDIEVRFPEWFFNECINHRQFLLEQFVRMKIFYNLKWESQDLRDAALIGRKRRQNMKENEKPNSKLMKLKNV